jgi:hypothetical protein
MQELNIAGHAIVLPYIQSKVGRVFQKQVTLIYSDWEVLCCDGQSKKGVVSIDNTNFDNI